MLNTQFKRQINMLENINKCDNSGDFAPLFSLDIKFLNISHKATENIYIHPVKFTLSMQRIYSRLAAIYVSYAYEVYNRYILNVNFRPSPSTIFDALGSTLSSASTRTP